MARSVYKICDCKDRVKCRHPWWFSFKQAAGSRRFRESLDRVLERHIDSKTLAETEAERLRHAIVDDKLTARQRVLLGLPAAVAPVLVTFTAGQLLDTYNERHLARTASKANQAYQVGILKRTMLTRPDGTTAPLAEWLMVDVNADTLERLREVRSARDVHKAGKRSNVVGGAVAANRDLRLLRAAFNWAIRVGYAERTPFKRGTESTVRLSAEASRSRRLQADEAERLLKACDPVRLNPKTKQPLPNQPWPLLRPLIEAALETGCRRGELLSLQWSQVELEESRRELWLPAGKTKTGKARRVPISKRLKAILEMRREALRTALELPSDAIVPATLFVFGNEVGQRHGAIKTAWRLACKRANIHDLHFHDLRREAGSRWMDGGVPLATIQKWLGHTNIAQTSTYLSTTTAGEHEAMRRFEERVGRLTPIDTEGETPHQDGLSSAEMVDKKPQQNTVRH